MATAADLESDIWEWVNDDGFLYKRKKRHIDPAAVSRPADPPPDQKLEARQRKERKIAALLKVRDKYAKELSLWENMENALRAMEQSAKDKKVADAEKTLGQGRIHPGEGAAQPNSSILDELLLQVEGQEAIINHITNLCEAAEALCDAHEENLTQSLLDLPVWESPQELMASLSEPDGCSATMK